MSYYSKYTSTPTNIDTEFIKTVCKIGEIDWNALNSRKDLSKINRLSTELNFLVNIKSINYDRIEKISKMTGSNFVFTGKDGEKYRSIFGAIIPERKVQALKKLSFIMSKLLLGFFINRFADMKLSKFTISMINRNQKNKEFVRFLRNEIESVYKKHPTYTACNAAQFKNTPIYNYMLAEYRNKNAEDIAKNVSVKAFDALITAIVSNAVNLPAGGLFAIPVKMLLTYAGVRLNGFGAMYHLITDLGGQVIKMDLILANDGFRLTNMAIFCFDKNGKMIQVDIKDPPQESYRLTLKEMKEILRKYTNSLNLDIFKKEAKQLCMI